MRESDLFRAFTRLRYRLFALLLIGLAAFLIGMGLSGCQNAKRYALSTTTVTAAVLELDRQFEGTDRLLQSRGKLFSAEEQHALERVRHDLQELRAGLRLLVKHEGGLTQILVDADRVRQFFEQGRASYTLARGIIAAHAEEFSPAEREALRLFDRQARRLKDGLQSLTTAPDGADISRVLADAVQVAAATAKLLAVAGVL